MRIAFIGNFEVDFSSETHYRKTFEKIGHTVIQLQENRTNVREILDAALKSDMLFWVHTHSWRVGSDGEILHMLKKLKDAKIPTVGYHLDLFMGLQREKDLKNDAYWKIEHFFTVDKLMADYLNQHTQAKGYYLPAGVYEDECILMAPNREKYPHDVIFTGSKGYHREYPYRVQLIEWLHATYGERFAHYGGGGRPSLRGLELNTLYSSAKIVIGDTLCKDFTYKWYFSDRYFECPSRGGFMIFPYIHGAEDFFEPNEEVVFYEYNDFVDLKSKIDHYLKDDLNRESIRMAGFERGKKDHNYTIRLQYIIDTIFK